MTIRVYGEPLTASELAAIDQREIIANFPPLATERVPARDPVELDEAIAAQRVACREAGAEWETAVAEAATVDLAAAVYGRQAVLARDRANVAQGRHQGSLSRLWELESQRG